MPRVGSRFFIDGLGDPEVEHPHDGVRLTRRKHDVARLEIAMSDVTGVRVPDGVEHRAHHAHRLDWRAPAQASPFDEVGLQRLPGEPFEHHPGEWSARTTRLEIRTSPAIRRRPAEPCIQNLHDGWMLELGDGLGLARKSLALLGGVAVGGRLEHLDGDGNVEDHVVPRIDDPETTFGHDPPHAVFSIEKGAGKSKWIRSWPLPLGNQHRWTKIAQFDAGQRLQRRSCVTARRFDARR